MKRAIILIMCLVLISNVAVAEVIKRTEFITDGRYGKTLSGKDIIEKQTTTRELFRGGKYTFMTGKFISGVGNVQQGPKYEPQTDGEQKIIKGSLGSYVKLLNGKNKDIVEERSTRARGGDAYANFPTLREVFRKTTITRNK